MPARIYILEDHAVMRRALVDFINNISEHEVSGAAETAEEALRNFDGNGVDLVLVDTALPGMNGIEFVFEIRRQWPGLQCLMLSGHGEDTYVQRAMEAGARGYVLKGDPDELPKAIQRVLEGEVYLSASLHGTERTSDDVS